MREVFRQAHGSGIVQSAHAINAGYVPKLLQVPPTLNHPSVHAVLQEQHSVPQDEQSVPQEGKRVPQEGKSVPDEEQSVLPVDAVWVRLPSGDGGVHENGAEVVAAVNQVIVGLGDMNVDVKHDVQVSGVLGVDVYVGM